MLSEPVGIGCVKQSNIDVKTQSVLPHDTFRLTPGIEVCPSWHHGFLHKLGESAAPPSGSRSLLNC